MYTTSLCIYYGHKGVGNHIKMDIFLESNFGRKVTNFFESRIEWYGGTQGFLEAVFEFSDSHLNDVDPSHLHSIVTFEYLLRLLYEFDCCEIPVISKITYAYQQILRRQCPPSFAILRKTEAETNAGRKRMSQILQELRQDIVPYTKWGRYYSEMVLKAFECEDYALLQFMLKYGISSFSPTEAETYSLARQFLYLVNYNEMVQFSSDELRKRVEDLLRHLSSEVIFSRRRGVLILCTMRIISRFQFYTEYSIEPIALTPLQVCYGMIRCLNLINEMLPEPFVTLTDVKRFILSFLKDEDVAFLKKSYKAFRKILPEGRKFYQPRSLKDLTRCKVRDCLQKPEPLPKLVSKLDIPIVLKGFILFDDAKRKFRKSKERMRA